MFEYKRYLDDDDYGYWDRDCIVDKYLELIKSAHVTDKEKEAIKEFFSIKDVVKKDKAKSETKIDNKLLLLIA